MLCFYVGGKVSLPYHVPFRQHDEHFNNVALSEVAPVVQADGHELDAIARMFPELTPRGVRVAMFHGDIARTILSNIGRAR